MQKINSFFYRFTGRVLELIVGVFMLFNSGMALVFESAGFIRAFLFGIQGYLNLWGEARVGWEVFNCRRIAVRKISTLKTVHQFDNLDDLCAICYHDLKPNSENVINFPINILVIIPIPFTVLRR